MRVRVSSSGLLSPCSMLLWVAMRMLAPRATCSWERFASSHAVRICSPVALRLAWTRSLGIDWWGACPMEHPRGREVDVMAA